MGSTPQKEEPAEHPIVTQRRECLETPENQTTLGMIECEARAAAAWEAEIPVLLDRVSSRLTPEAASALAESQEAWSAFRDAELEFLREHYGSMDGSMWRVILAGRGADLWEARGLTLWSLERELALH